MARPGPTVSRQAPAVAAKDLPAPIAKIDTAIASLRAIKNMTLGGSAFVLQPAPVGGGSGEPTGDILCLVNGDGIVAGIASANGNHACATAADAASVVTIPVGSGFISGLWIGIAKSGPPSIGKLVFEVTPPGGRPLEAKKFECGTSGWPAAPLFTSIELFSAGDIKTGCSNAGGATRRRLSQATRVLDASRLTVVATPAPQAGEAPTPPALNSVPLAGVLSADQLAAVAVANGDAPMPPSPPTVTQTTANLAQNAATLTIAGFNFDASTPGANTVVFSGAASPAVGVVTTATSTLLTVTFSTPPTNLGALNAVVTSSGVPSGTATQIATVVLPYAYVTDAGNFVSVCRVSGSPPTLSSCATSGSGFNNPTGIAVSGGYAYVANNNAGSVSVCPVNPSTRALVSADCTSGSGFTNPRGIAVSGGYAYVADNGGSVSVCRVSGAPPTLSSCATSGSGFTNPAGIAVSGGYAYVADNGGRSVSVCRVSGAPPTLSSCATSGSGLTDPAGIAVSGGYAYVADSGGSVSVCRVSGSPPTLSSCATSGSGFSSPFGIALT